MSNERINYRRKNFLEFRPDAASRFIAGCGVGSSNRGLLLDIGLNDALLDAAGWEALKSIGDAAFRDGDFRAFRPAPKLRPYTLPEAAAKFAEAIEKGLKLVRKSDGTHMELRSVTTTAFTTYPAGYVQFERCDEFKWSNGSPFGVEE